MPSAGLATLRLAVAAVFMTHGLHALFGLFGGPGVGPGGLDAVSARLDAAGLSPGYAMAVLTSVLQLGGGGLLAAGWLTRWAALALLLYVGLTGWMVHLRWGFFLNWVGDPGRGHGLEHAMVLAAALVCLMLAGGGALSLDGRRANRAASRALGRARALRRG
jgi:putative oxidoreductase